MTQSQRETNDKKLKNSYLAVIVIFLICLFNVAVFRSVPNAKLIVWVSSAGAFISLLALVLLFGRLKKNK
ncbi:hypothetical protein DN068_20135 [Taibaiella soli]|uniref:Uncharacterized protein n=1 Tax=Taibaiella soli TaxID=1649169 RepID=A0A2W2A6T9_9BACT|nr:hypothetical protein DN068_20135 [Taibaiella soli]